MCIHHEPCGVEETNGLYRGNAGVHINAEQRQPSTVVDKGDTRHVGERAPSKESKLRCTKNYVERLRHAPQQWSLGIFDPIHINREQVFQSGTVYIRDLSGYRYCHDHVIWPGPLQTPQFLVRDIELDGGAPCTGILDEQRTPLPVGLHLREHPAVR